MIKFIQVVRSIPLLLIFFSASAAQAQTIGPISTANLPNVITVGHQDADFTTISAAIDSIYDASETNPYLVMVAPGEYKVRSRIIMKEHVYLKGSGVELTKLIGKVRGETKSLIDAGGYNTSIESMSIEIPRNFNFPASVIVSSDRGNIYLKDVSLRISLHPSLAPRAIAVYNDFNVVYLDNVNIAAAKSGGESVGVASSYGFEISNSTIAAKRAVGIEFFGTGTIDNSTLYGSEAAIYSIGSFETLGAISYLVRNHSLLRSSSNGVPIKEVLFTGGFPATFNILRSTIVNNSSGPNTDAVEVNCLYSDNGEMQALDNDCNDLL